MRAEVLALVILLGSSLAAQAVVHIGLPNDALTGTLCKTWRLTPA